MPDSSFFDLRSKALLDLLEQSPTDREKVMEDAEDLVWQYLDSQEKIALPISLLLLGTKIGGEYLISPLRYNVIELFKSDVLASSELILLMDIFSEKDVDRGYLATEWMKDDNVFSLALAAYIMEHSKRGMDEAAIQHILRRELEGLLTYKGFTRAQVKALTSKIHHFNPHVLIHPEAPFSDTFLSRAKRICQDEVISYLESCVAEKSIILQEVEQEIDPGEFQEIINLLNTTSDDTTPIEQEGFLGLKTLFHIFMFFNNNPYSQFSRERFISEVKSIRDMYPQSTPKAILQQVRNSYQSLYNDILAIKLLLEADDIKIYAAHDQSVDSTLSSHPNVGTLIFKEREIVCKYTSQLFLAAGVSIRELASLADFIRKARALKAAVPGVVDVLPSIFLNKTKDGIKIGYFMERASGKTLSAIKTLTSEEIVSIERQFDESVNMMLEAGYALYDFHEKNVLWDGEKLTLIDLSPAGFKPEALEHADTLDVIYRMRAMLCLREQESESDIHRTFSCRF